jgi:hypothetical protein
MTTPTLSSLAAPRRGRSVGSGAAQRRLLMPLQNT